MSTEIVKIRGHHLSNLTRIFIAGLEGYRSWKQDKPGLSGKEHGEKFEKRLLILEERLATEPDLLIKLVADEPDFLCKVCPPPQRGSGCFGKRSLLKNGLNSLKGRSLPDGLESFDHESIREMGLGPRVNKVYTVRQLQETFRTNFRGNL